eukprot:1412786-Rhodomonas_salina.1
MAATISAVLCSSPAAAFKLAPVHTRIRHGNIAYLSCSHACPPCAHAYPLRMRRVCVAQTRRNETRMRVRMSAR